ncbi:uncharacterized protein LOC142165244 [Nicotiana tabacum]|uniref:Uncharacterized protein LOC142165244 n=1 Tax=Nicotiana tabacum TaxID=4097 RepID=A0AC58S4M2_TOBAC
MPIIINRGYNLTDCLSIFEVGSTSGTCNVWNSSTPASTAHRDTYLSAKNKYKLLTLEAYDKFVYAELSDRNIDSSLYLLVTKHMIHGPFGYLNPSNSCMKRDCCKFKYPKELAEQTTKEKKSYPIYKRRQIETPVEVRGYNIDNSWVVPYNPFLIKKFNCHINVEICSDIKVVKYLYKYICKGHDKIAFSVHDNDTNVHIDEIKEYQSPRWVSPPEGAWNLFAFSISEMTPSVLQLQLHLQGQQFVSFKTNIRSKDFIALATTSSGVAASILHGGRTAHSRFKIPIDIDENFTCNISKQTALATLIQDSKLIVWDEVSMAKKKTIEVFDTLLKDLMNMNILFGGKVVVTGGDFRQTLHVVRNGKKEDFICESLLYSDIWNDLEKLCLSENMHAKEDPAFCEYLMRIGNGREENNNSNKVEIPHNLIIPFTTETQSLNQLFNVTYPNLHTFFSNPSSMTSRVILTTKNDFVVEINDMLIHQLSNNAKIYTAIDKTTEPSDQCQFEDFLHTLNPPNLPPYKLTLKKIYPVILLRNLNPCEGLCNGTRLICHDIKRHLISATIPSGDFKNTHIFIPKIPLLSSQDEKLPVAFKRTQFPLRLCFAMTINKAQGQTLDFVGIYLCEPVFSHGQLYVALSRVKSSKNVKILIRPPTPENKDDHSTYNIVYEEVIGKTFS